MSNKQLDSMTFHIAPPLKWGVETIESKDIQRVTVSAGDIQDAMNTIFRAANKFEAENRARARVLILDIHTYAGFKAFMMQNPEICCNPNEPMFEGAPVYCDPGQDEPVIALAAPEVQFGLKPRENRWKAEARKLQDYLNSATSELNEMRDMYDEAREDYKIISADHEILKDRCERLGRGKRGWMILSAGITLVFIFILLLILFIDIA